MVTDDEGLSREQLMARLRECEGARRTAEALTQDREELLRELQAHQLALQAQSVILRDSEEALRASWARYSDLYELVPVAFATLDRNGVIEEINPAGAAMLGNSRSALVGKPLVAVARFERADDLRRHLNACLTRNNNIPVATELTFTTRRGKQEVQVVSSSVRAPNGVPACRMAFLDVSQRKHADRMWAGAAEAQRSLHNLKALDHASMAITRALVGPGDNDWQGLLRVIALEARTVADAAHAWLVMARPSGQPSDSSIDGGADDDTADDAGTPPQPCGLRQALAQVPQAIRGVELHEHPTFAGLPPSIPPLTSFLCVPVRYLGQRRGTLFLANKRGQAQFSEEDQVAIELLADRVAVAMEIARLRQFEARERARLDFLSKAGPQLAEALDLDSTLTAIARLVVPALADLCTVHLLEEDGSFTLVKACHRQPGKEAAFGQVARHRTAALLPELVRAALASGQPQRRALTGASPDDDVIQDPALCAVAHQLDAQHAMAVPLMIGKRALGFLKLMTAKSGRAFDDATAWLALELAHDAALAIERSRLYGAARDAVRARDAVLAVVSHDLRNPLGAILLSAEALAVSGPAGERRTGARRVETIRLSAIRMRELIEGLQDASTIEAGQFRVNVQPERAASLVEEAVKMVEPQAEAAGLKLTAFVAPGLPELSCDRARILQVLLNLTGNAIKFTPAHGALRVEAAMMGNAICFAVSDTGRGIAPDELPHVFDRYWRAQGGPRAGSGLGLFIAKAIVEAHGGRIWTRSERGAGSTFYFIIPLGPRQEV